MSVNTATQTKVIVFTDGAARGAPGPASCGAVVLDDQENLLYRRGTGTSGFRRSTSPNGRGSSSASKRRKHTARPASTFFPTRN